MTLVRHRILRNLVFLLLFLVDTGSSWSFARHHDAVKRWSGSGGGEEARTDPCIGLTAEEIEALPSLGDLLESGAARRQVYKGAEISERFHWKTRALNGEFGKELGVDSRDDNEHLVDGLQTALTSKWPATVSITVVSAKHADVTFVDEVRNSVYVEVGGATEVDLVVKQRKNRVLSITCTYSAAHAGVPSAVRGRLKQVKGAKMIF
jgi:hypothetical protein